MKPSNLVTRIQEQFGVIFVPEPILTKIQDRINNTLCDTDIAIDEEMRATGYMRPGEPAPKEVDTVSDEDLEAASEFYDNMKSGKATVERIQQLAMSRYDQPLSAESIDRVASRFACSPASLEECVAFEVGAIRALRYTPTKPARKPYQVCIKLELYYDIPAELFPEWADEEGVVKLVDAAFDDKPHNNLPSAFGKDGILQINPTEISIDSITSA